MYKEEAGFWVRFGAGLLDGLIVGVPLSIIGYLIAGQNFDREPITNVLSILYALLLPVIWKGFTIGKKICGIRIRRVNDHEPPGLGTMLLRNFVAAIIYVLTFGIGIIVSCFMVAIREDRRSIHDFVAGTEVVWD
ncbi:RDD family protein [Paenibacillus sp. JCM 10914]|uniref:RDD family protein n=1 Tax=Paenibacillus sp. JCM 10914 TaxID=1236974 RepID=UPI0003CC90CE|nr:RDD family protein [Paenibacillus sp. JCM 10914]GAE06923.1 hypothetical protein JCM10914_3116 [Paenibacillus sp. JCM 10914]